MTFVLIIIEYWSKAYKAFSTVLLTIVFVEIAIFIVTILVALIRIRRTIKRIPELRVNRCLMCLHLALSFIFSILFVIEYIVFATMAAGGINRTREKVLSSLFIMKQCVGLFIYELILYMLYKIISPLAKSNLKAIFEGTAMDENDDTIEKMLQNIKIPMFLLQQNKVMIGDLIQKYSDCKTDSQRALIINSWD